MDGCWAAEPLDNTHASSLGFGLTISPLNTEVSVFDGSSSGTWHIGQHVPHLYLCAANQFPFIFELCRGLLSPIGNQHILCAYQLRRVVNLCKMLCIMRSGKGCMHPQGLRFPRGRNCAHTTDGLHALGLCLSPITTCPRVARACAILIAFGLVPTVCPLRWASVCAWLVLPAFACCAQTCM